MSIGRTAVDRRYRHILVPLDGSKLGELALPHAFDLARLTQGDVTLLHILSTVAGIIAASTPYPIFVDEQEEVLKGRALQHLRSICEQLPCDIIAVHPVVEVGPPAETIIDYVSEHHFDLIVMSSHGHSGLRQWVFGCVADKVLRGAGVHVLLVRAQPQPEIDDSQ